MSNIPIRFLPSSGTRAICYIGTRGKNEFVKIFIALGQYYAAWESSSNLTWCTNAAFILSLSNESFFVVVGKSKWKHLSKLGTYIRAWVQSQTVIRGRLIFHPPWESLCKHNAVPPFFLRILNANFCKIWLQHNTDAITRTHVCVCWQSVTMEVEFTSPAPFQSHCIHWVNCKYRLRANCQPLTYPSLITRAVVTDRENEYARRSKKMVESYTFAISASANENRFLAK